MAHSAIEGSKRGSLEWVVIEELETGLHPNAISTTTAVVLELIRRGYKVCISTRSPHVLDVVWALQFLKKNGVCRANLPMWT